MYPVEKAVCNDVPYNCNGMNFLTCRVVFYIYEINNINVIDD